jgi:outer membrane protein assembly factor BamB
MMMRKTLYLLAVLAGPTGLCAAEPLPEYFWPQWRGPERTGVATADPWPATLNTNSLVELWRIPLGPSYSGPIVYGEQVFVTETLKKKEEVVRALDRETGDVIWTRRWPGCIKVPFFARANGSWIRSTPACDGPRLYVGGIRDVLVCLDTSSGDEIWRVDFVESFGSPSPNFGFVCSPLLDGDFVYVQAGGAFVKLDKLTGGIIWRSLEDGGGMFHNAFSSPVKATVQGSPQLVVQTRERLVGVDEATGDELWSQDIEAYRGMNILTPTVLGDRIFTSAHSGSSQLFELALRDESFHVERVWENRAQAYMSSPVVIDEYLYMHLKNQRFTCLDLETGETQWTSKPFGKYWSLVVQRDRILALDERGDLLLVRADSKSFNLIDRLHISDAPTWAHLAVAGDMVFVRELNAQVAFRFSASTLK